MRCAGRMADQKDTARIASIAGDVRADPSHHARNVFQSCRIRAFRGEAVLHVYTDDTVPSEIKQDVRIDLRAAILFSVDERAAMDEQGHRRRFRPCGSEHVERLPRVIAVGDVVDDGDPVLRSLGENGVEVSYH